MKNMARIEQTEQSGLPRFRGRWTRLYGVRIADVARKSGVSERHLSCCLSGKSSISLAAAIRVAKVMKVEVSELGAMIGKAREDREARAFLE